MSNPRLSGGHDTHSRGREGVSKAADILAPIAKFLPRDLLPPFLLFASIVLLILFLSLVGSLGSEASGTEVPLSTITHIAKNKGVRTAELLDYDHQVVVETDR